MLKPKVEALIAPSSGTAASAMIVASCVVATTWDRPAGIAAYVVDPEPLPGWTGEWNPSRVSVEAEYPFSGHYDGAVNTAVGQDAALYQTITAPRTGTFTLIAAVASSLNAQLGVDVAGVQIASVTTTPNVGYQTRSLTFSATAGQPIKTWFYAPAASGWATIDSATLN